MGYHSEVEVAVREATPDDRSVIWQWVNDPVTRENSFDSSRIPWSDHVAWFDRVMDDDKRVLLIGETSRSVGVVRFDIESTHAVVSVNLAPEARGRGLGSQLIEAATNWFTARHPVCVVAWIRPSNRPSVSAFEHAGYRHAGREHEDRLAYEYHPEGRTLSP